MAGPGIREIGRCIRMALLAGFQKVLLDARFRIVRTLNIMYAVAVIAHCLGRVGVRVLGIEQHRRRAMKIRDIGVEDIGRYIMPGHHLFISMAGGAELR